MDFSHVWEELFDIPLVSFKGPNVWRYIAAFLLSFKEEAVDHKKINDFIFKNKCLGRYDSGHFVGELMPLPRPSNKDISPYRSLWPSVEDYYDEVAPKRIAMILEQLKANGKVKLVISYDRRLLSLLLSPIVI